MEEVLREIYSMEDMLDVVSTDGDGTSVKAPFVIDTDTKADWAIKIIKNEEALATRLVTVIDQEIEMLEAKKSKIQNNANCGGLKRLLADYFDGLEAGLKNDTKAQIAYKLPSGSLVFKKPTVEYIKNEDDVLMSLAENDKTEFIKTKLSLDWAALKKVVEICNVVVDANEDIVDGVFVDEDGDIRLQSDGQIAKNQADLRILKNVAVVSGTKTIIDGITTQLKEAAFIVK